MNTSRSSQSDGQSPAPSSNDISRVGLYKLDDYLLAHGVDLEAAEAKQPTSSPRGKVTNGKSSNALKPIAIGAHSSKFIVLLHQKQQALGLPQPVFTFHGYCENKWRAELNFPGLDVAQLQDLKSTVSFNSKHEAKESVSQQACEALEVLEQNGTLSKSRTVIKNSAQENVEREPITNYVGQLLEYQTSVGLSQPTYTDYKCGTLFACLVTIEPDDQTFSTTSSLHASKKEARQHAASCAVSHLKDQGIWPDSAGGIRKKKKAAAQLNPANLIAPNGSLPPSASYAQQCAHLAAALSLPTPAWRYTPNPAGKDFYSVACLFHGAGPHEGPIGEVRHVFGRKKAKEECAKLTYEYLASVRRERVRLMDDMLGKGRDGKEASVEFEDAVEDLMN